MTRTPRPLRPGDLLEAAATHQALADEYRAEHAAHVQTTIGTEIDAGYPATTSGAGGTGTATPSSRPEALTIRPDRTATEAVTLAALQRKTLDAAATVLRGLRARHPDRKIRSCPRCGHVIGDGMTRCNRMTDDGQRCGVCRHTGNGCPRDGAPLEPGEKMRNGECNACRLRIDRAQKAAARAQRAPDNWQDRMGTTPKSDAVASVANLVEGMADIEVAD